MSLRRFLAKPALALAANLPESMPQMSERTAIPMRMPPYTRMTSISLPCAIVSLLSRESKNHTMTNGIRHSRMTSKETKMGERMEGFLYSRTLFANVLISIRKSPPHYIE